MTHWATHNFNGKAKTPKFQMTRQASITKALESKQWENLLQVA